MNPTRGSVGRRVGGIPNPDASLLERVLSRANLSDAWKQVKANRGAPSVDDMPIDDFMAYAWEHWPKIRSSIFAGSYKPLPVKRVDIPKATGGTRPLGIPAVLGRLIQQAVAQVLALIFDPGFSQTSFGFRKG
jgi:RNA-directed DNA polymerase